MYTYIIGSNPARDFNVIINVTCCPHTDDAYQWCLLIHFIYGYKRGSVTRTINIVIIFKWSKYGFNFIRTALKVDYYKTMQPMYLILNELMRNIEKIFYNKYLSNLLVLVQLLYEWINYIRFATRPRRTWTSRAVIL